MATLEQTRRTVDAYAAAQGTITANLLRILIALWRGIPDFNNPDMVRAWAARSTVDTDVALANVRGAARGYMLTRLTQLGAAPSRLPEVVDTYERGGTVHFEVYQRPARERNYVERTALKQGVDAVAAAESAAHAFDERLTRIVETDVAVTSRDEIDRVLTASPKVTGYRRVIHPEMSKTGTCGLCIAASTRVYSKGDLMPLHGGCHCTVDAITADSDAGDELNREDLAKLYTAAGGTGAEKLKNVRVKTVEHGELGPVLIRSGSKFRTVDQVNADTKYAPRASTFARQDRATDRTNWRAMRVTSERSIRYLENARSRGTDMVDLGTGVPTKVADIAKAIQYHRDLITRAISHGA